PVRRLGFTPDGSCVAAPTVGHVIGVWGVTGALPFHFIPGHGEALGLLRFFPAGERLVTTGRGGTAKVWDLSGRELATLIGHGGRIAAPPALAGAPDGRTLASGNSHGEVKLWDARTGLELASFQPHAGPVTAAEFSP